MKRRRIIILALAALALAALGQQICIRVFSPADPAARREREQAREVVRQLREFGNEPAQPPQTILINRTAFAIPPPPGSARADIASPLPEYAIKAAFLSVNGESGEAAGYSVSEIVEAADMVDAEHFRQFRLALRESLGAVELPQGGDATLAMTLTPGRPVILLEDGEDVVTTALRRRGISEEEPAHTTVLESFVLLNDAVVRLTLALSGPERQPVEKGLALLREWRDAIRAANP